MDAPSFYHSVIAGDRSMLAMPLRTALRLASVFYRAGVTLRNRRYDRDPSRTIRLPVPVISVGNITTGGTGKTPLVMHIARALIDRGRKPAILSRGYKSTTDREADELLLVRRRAPGAVCIANPDRVSAAQQAIEQHGADVIVLDDAFQHRRIARDLNVVVIDATCPFGYGHLLPRGLLREPLDGLRRASLVVVSRADQASDDALARIDATLTRYAATATRVRCRHRPVGFVNLAGEAADDIPNDLGPVFCFAAIGNPGAFRRTVHDAGVSIAGARWWPDHHQYGAQDASALSEAATRAGARALLTTEKDAVKLMNASIRWSCPIYALRIQIDFLDDGDTILDTAMDRLIGETRGADDKRQVQTD